MQRDRHRKRWLISRLKTSGSKRRYLSRYVMGEDYHDRRHRYKVQDLEDLPKREGMSSWNWGFWNSKVSTTQLKRFLDQCVGMDWDEVYHEITERIPTQLLYMKDTAISWYVYTHVEIDGLYVYDAGPACRDFPTREPLVQTTTRDSLFYVHPETNILCRLPMDTEYPHGL